MATPAALSLPVAVAVGALLLSPAATAQMQQGQEVQQGPQGPAQPPSGYPPVIVLPGQTPAPPQQYPGQAFQPAQPQPQPQPQPMPQTGEVALSFSGTATQAPQAIAIAPDVQMLTFTMYMTSMNTAPDPFMNIMSGVCSGQSFMHARVDKMAANGFCNYTDVDGDHVFERFVIPLQSSDNPLEARGAWRGGTGKYQGLQGTFVLSGIILPMPNEDVIQIVGLKVGRYALHRPETAAPTQPPPQEQAPSSSSGSRQ